MCSRINGPIILLGGGKEDENAAFEIENFFHPKESRTSAKSEKVLRNELNKKVKIFSGVGKFSLNQSASVVKLSERVFTHDTAIMHIASAFKKEVFSIWGKVTQKSPSTHIFKFLTRPL